MLNRAPSHTQTQAHVQQIAQRQQQSLALLAMNALDLLDHVQQEIDANPFLDIDPNEEEVFSFDRRLGAEASTDMDDYAEQKTLERFVTEQLPFLQLSLSDTVIARVFIGLLDENGLVRDTDADVALLSERPEADVADVRARLQRLDPPGMFSRSPFEAVLFQMYLAGDLDPHVEALLDAARALPGGTVDQAMANAGLTAEQMGGVLSRLRKYKPYPLADIDLSPPIFQPPDVFVRRGPNGVWTVELNPVVYPRLRVNAALFERMSSASKAPGDKSYLRSTYSQARQLSDCILRRGETLLRVSQILVAHQSASLTCGPRALRPLTLRDVAEKLSLHVSTISRATSQKTIATPAGTFPLKSLLARTASGKSGEEVSCQEIQSKIADLVAAENAQRPLSDDRIAEILSRNGIEVARRTVAKYRQVIGVLSTRQRRRASKH